MDDTTYSFIVRVWREKTEEPVQSNSQNAEKTQETWRGWIESVGNGHRLYFQDLQSAIHFIQDSTGIQQTSRHSWLKKLFKRLQHE